MTILLAILWSIWSRVKLVGYFLLDNWRVTLPVIGIIILGIFFWRSCGPKPAKLNEKEIQEAITAIEKKEDAKLKEILVNADVREKNIDANLANASAEANKAAADAKKKYDVMTAEELAAEIERRK